MFLHSISCQQVVNYRILMCNLITLLNVSIEDVRVENDGEIVTVLFIININFSFQITNFTSSLWIDKTGFLNFYFHDGTQFAN